MNKNKLKVSEILGYAVGGIGDATSYNFVIALFSFFMTTIAGISPAVAGMIISAGVVWDAVTDPIVGYLIDNTKGKYGKRRPWMLGSAIPLGAAMLLMFLKVDLPQTQKIAYYLIMVFVFWLSYTAFNIAYYSFGSVITEDDSERVKVQAYRNVLSYVGLFCASSVPTFGVAKLVEKGFTDGDAWSIMAAVAAVISVVSIILMWRFTRGKESAEEVSNNQEKMNVGGFFKDIVCLMKMKPYLLIIACALLANVYMTLFNSSLLYYVCYNMGLSEAQASMMFTTSNIVAILFSPVIAKLVEKFNKTNVFVGTMVFSGLVMIMAKFTGIPNIGVGCVYVALTGLGTCAYWLCIFNFLFDVVDYNEFKTGTRRDGIIMSYYSFLLKLGGAAAAAIQGILLEKSGFNVQLEVQNESALGMIGTMFTILPGIIMIGSGLVMLLTPLKDKEMNLLRVELDKKRAGEEYSTEKFASIMK